MKVEVVIVDPVFHIELTPDEAWNLKVFFRNLEEEEISLAITGCEFVIDPKDIYNTVKNLYNALPPENSNVPYAPKKVLFQSEERANDKNKSY